MIRSNNKSESRTQTTVWNFFFLNIRFIVSIINGVLIIPLYLHFIDSPIYGAWLATGNILSWITIVDPGVGGVILQRIGFAIGRKDNKEVGMAIASGTAISILLFFLCVIAGYAVSFFIGSFANIDMRYRADITSAFRIGIWGTALSLLSNTFTNIILAYQKTKLHGVFVNSIMGASILVTVVLLFNNFGVYALAYNSLFTGFSTLVYALILTGILVKKHSIHLSFEKDYLKHFSKVFAYTFSSRLFETIASNVDLILVSRYLGSQYVTALDLSRRPLKIVTGLANNVSISMLPALSHLFGSGDNARIRVVTIRIWTIILWLSGIIVGGFILFNYSFMMNWVGKRFWISTTNNNLLCISFFLLSIGYNLSNITYSMGDIKNNSLINVVRNSIYLILLYLLTKSLGITGVILAFGLPVLILLIYYPRKLFSKAQYSKPDVKEVLRETFIVSIILIICLALSYLCNLKFSWPELFIWTGLYILSYVIVLFSFSKRFKEEFGNIIFLLTSKLNFLKSNH